MYKKRDYFKIEISKLAAKFRALIVSFYLDLVGSFYYRFNEGKNRG